MTNEIDILLGGGMTPQQTETDLMSAALRGQLNEGNALGMSTIGGVADFGRQQSQAARQGAKQAGRLKQALEKEARDAKRAEEEEARDAKRAEERDLRVFKRAEEKRKQSLKDKKDYWDYQVANPKPTKGRGSAYDGRVTGTMGKKEITMFEDAVSDAAGSLEALNTYDPAFSKPTVLGMGAEGVYGVNALENSIARNMPILSSDAEKAKERWWADFNMFHKLPERHKLFGAALTPTELKSWNEAAINPSMGADQVQDRLNLLKKLQANAISRMAGNARLKGATDEYIQYNLGEELSITGEDVQSQRKAPQAALDMLKANPNMAGAFKEKYGYLPQEQ